AQEGRDLRALVRSEPSDDMLVQAIGRLWSAREDRYSELREELKKKGPLGPKIEMSYIGG
ncbi:MAG: GTP 3',8-cyclase MoaA, partial [Betaproteobacteria bacterium]|nr:GTP 3',8-cyclase MoaA [Betaproteobacteria bacterium]